MNISKRVEQNSKKVDRKKEYPLREALELLKNCNGAKFDETVEAHVNLGVDPRHADQNIRGTVTYPHGTGRKVRVLVLTKSKVDEALQAGADYAGLEEYLEKIQNGWTDVDVIIATPDVMGQVGKLGKILGPKGLMPNPKSGTVTNDVAAAVKEIKAGRVEIRVDKTGIVHTIVGKKSFPIEHLEENVRTLISTLMRLRPPSVKGAYIQKVTLTTTMGPGVRVDKSSIIA
ncbi:MAG: 50S ribosomal protein L1 [Candidatus Marinimicrobia bacterium ADurb.Bin030]|jgi:large subunit ribosomal protein L1|nr:MAG: 50S ribosomal protein L1 [Candidatus Marinimicrobia bacterium ADurb.Bin030]HOO14753.1 50S ribosomal protein L1 [Candidatus Neomarinimicrobiota bacterium]HPX99754.1 50S ribosomal protein L1 [Candidatus Neomarinimicrobiota bacterium]HQC61527.1 50S ribosomal protein L1 [Candidatus Neomarinimicrobiota bacterium]